MPGIFGTSFSVGNLLVSLVMLGFFGVAFVSGIWLWNDEPRGYRVSSVVHVAQIPYLESFPLTYQFLFGFGITLTPFSGDGFVSFYVGAKSFLYLLTDVIDFRIGVNIWAAIIAAYLWKRRRITGAPSDAETTDTAASGSARME